MHLANPKWNCTDQKEEHFIDGITNGASWSSLSGGMQDYNYVHSNCFEITLELGCDRFPKSSDLEKYWLDNKKALVEFAQQVGSCSQAPARRSRHFNARDLNIVHVAHIWPPCFHVLRHVGCCWFKHLRPNARSMFRLTTMLH